PVADSPDPRANHRGIEGDLADDVRRERDLVEHRLDRGVVADERVTLGIAGDPDLLKPVTELRHRAEQRGGSVERPKRLIDVAGDDEHLVDPESLDARDQLLERGL